MVRRVTTPEHPTPARPRTEFTDRLTHEKRIRDEADYFSVFLYSTQGSHRSRDLDSLDGAKSYALELRRVSADNPRDIMIYAVKGPHQTLVVSLSAKGVWKEPK